VRLKIALDVMGGDFAPRETVLGALMAAEQTNAEILLVGDSTQINKILNEKGHGAHENLRVIHTTEVITNDDKPTTAIRKKKDSSMVKCFELVASGKADAMISAGNTGALLAGSIHYIKRIDGILRPALAPILPGERGEVVLIDGGANTNIKPVNLLQFAVMGSVYSEYVLKKKSPEVGLLNVGAEEGKGNELSRHAFDIIKDSGLNFLGNLEARDALTGKADVIVCDGFSGNILLKAIEGAGMVLFDNIKKIIKRNVFSKIGALMMKKGLMEFKAKYDYKENGGAPFLGVGKCVMKAHGSSRATSICKTILQSCDFVSSGAVLIIEKKLKEIGSLKEG